MKLIAAPENNLFLVGDDDQSIYEFRGSSPRLMLSFPKEFPDTHIVRLSVNYRSHREIVEAASALIRKNKDRFPKKLISAKGAGGNVSFRVFPTEKEECRFISERIAALSIEERKETAILARTHGGLTSILKELTERGIPFVAADRMPNIFQKPVCAPIFACFNYLIGDRSRGNFLKFMNTPSHGLLREDFLTETVSLSALRKEKEAEHDHFTAGKIRAFEQQLSLLEKLKTPYAMIHYFRHGMGYDDFVREKAKRELRDPAEDFETLDAVTEEAKGYLRIPAFFDAVRAYAEKMEEAKTKAPPENAVTVSTLHAVKGLQYETVYLLDVCEKNMPHERALLSGDIEEERRLFYVGITRAISRLVLCTAKKRYGRTTEESRFIREMGMDGEGE